VHEWAALIASETPDVDACAAGATFTRQDLACIVYTSGTGGAPRGVMQHHGAVLHNVEGCIDVIANDFRAGATRSSSPSFRQAMPMSIAAGRCSRSGWARRSIIPRAGEARLQYRGSAADDHGRGARACSRCSASGS
jgi:acyl-CoA synthetase (AMP-forming)/AMP-acid ligase II